MKNLLYRSMNRRIPGAFTLLELLIVMGVIAALSVLTLVSVGQIVNDARLSSATNTVVATLDNARAAALRRNAVVVVVFRPRFEGQAEQAVDLHTAQWTGDSLIVLGPQLRLVDRFVPMTDVPVRSLPKGIKVAGPSYGNPNYANPDFVWTTQTHLPGIDASNPISMSSEVGGGMIGVMFGPDGTTITGNPRTDAAGIFVDFNNDRQQQWLDVNHVNPVLQFVQWLKNDEPIVQIVPFLAVYDDDEARKLQSGPWTQADPTVYLQDLVGDPDFPADFPGYITKNANRIHFNRYSGVVMR